jgi:enoyl-CoA hydratase/3-hydroxyacyl-CoA dehydrogenase
MVPAAPLVNVDVNDTIATITIDRPAALNSINPAVVHQLELALAGVEADPAVRGIVIAGAGKAFVVGADIEFFVRNIVADDIDRIVKFTAAGQRLLNAIDQCPKTVVARVDGAAWGAGTEIALACDFVVATPQATFALPETSLGIYPGLGGTQRSSRALGVGIAKWLIYTGKIISAADAWKIGLVGQIAARERLDEFCAFLASGRAACDTRPAMTPELVALADFFARARVDDILTNRADTLGNPALERARKQAASKPPLALRLAKKLIDAGATVSLSEGLQMELSHLVEVFSDPVAQSLLRARAKQSAD